MAMSVKIVEIGVDVSKDELLIARSDRESVETLINQAPAITQWLRALSGHCRIAVEATNTYHLQFIETAHRLGHRVFVVDGYCLNRYRESLRVRAKTDASDARLLLRFLRREWRDLRPWTPPSKGYRALHRLLHRRATLVRVRTTLQQSLRSLPELKAQSQRILSQLQQLDRTITQRINQTICNNGWRDDQRRCQQLEGMGELTAAALVMAYQRGSFRSADAFIAFLGMDVRVRDSGRCRGRRKLTKQGDPELRRLLHLAAMRACSSATWQAFYHRHLNRGLSKIQALVILARKLARVAFALLKNKTVYTPDRRQKGCPAT